MGMGMYEGPEPDENTTKGKYSVLKDLLQKYSDHTMNPEEIG